MATLDVADVLDSPEFQSIARLVRIAQVVGSNGRLTGTAAAPVDILGVIQPAGETAYKQFPELARLEGSLTMWTKTPLVAKTAARGPDLILWNRQTYVVSGCMDWGHYGRGYMQAMLQLQNLVQA